MSNNKFISTNTGFKVTGVESNDILYDQVISEKDRKPNRLNAIANDLIFDYFFTDTATGQRI